METSLPSSPFASHRDRRGPYCGGPTTFASGRVYRCGEEIAPGEAKYVQCAECHTVAQAFKLREASHWPPDTTLVKSTRPATCAVCREVVTGSIELPTGEHVCGKCCCIALRNMIDDAAACRKDGK